MSTDERHTTMSCPEDVSDERLEDVKPAEESTHNVEHTSTGAPSSDHVDGGATPTRESLVPAPGSQYQSVTYDSNTTTTVDEDVPMTFAQRLMEILSDEANSSAITWLPHGKGWIITDKKAFSTDILPKYFSRKSKYTSFTRKLNRWNFTRVTRGPECGSYYHPLFQRDKPEMVLQMSCIDSKAPQQLQPLNPVALGFGMMMMPSLLDDPAALPSWHNSSPLPMQNTMDLPPSALAPAEGESDSRNSSNAHGTNNTVSHVDPAQQSTAMAPPTGTEKSSESAAEVPANTAYLAYQAQYYAMMMAQQQAFSGSPVPPLLPSQQKPLPLPPKPKKSALRQSQAQPPNPSSSGEAQIAAVDLETSAEKRKENDEKTITL